MRFWPALFVIATMVCWGAYVPAIHHGQQGFGTARGPLRGFLFVGVAYFAIAAIVLVVLLVGKTEPAEYGRKGVTLSFIAGVLGAVGALSIIFALKSGGRPIVVAPLVFAGAPIVNTIVSMMWDKPGKAPQPLFYVGIALAAVGAAMVLRFKPPPAAPHAALAAPVTTAVAMTDDGARSVMPVTDDGARSVMPVLDDGAGPGAPGMDDGTSDGT